MLGRWRHNLREERGVVTLETFAVISIWFLLTFTIIGMFAAMGQSMMMRTYVNRAAQQAAAKGCLSTTTVKQLLGSVQGGFRVSSAPTVAAYRASVNKSSPSFNIRNYVKADGTTVGSPASAKCAYGEVPDRDFIIIVVRYRQPLLVFGSFDRNVTAVVVSQSQEGT